MATSLPFHTDRVADQPRPDAPLRAVIANGQITFSGRRRAIGAAVALAGVLSSGADRAVPATT